jgi:hypothetical protein
MHTRPVRFCYGSFFGKQIIDSGNFLAGIRISRFYLQCFPVKVLCIRHIPGIKRFISSGNRFVILLADLFILGLFLLYFFNKMVNFRNFACGIRISRLNNQGFLQKFCLM